MAQRREAPTVGPSARTSLTNSMVSAMAGRRNKLNTKQAIVKLGERELPLCAVKFDVLLRLVFFSFKTPNFIWFYFQ